MTARVLAACLSLSAACLLPTAAPAQTTGSIPIAGRIVVAETQPFADVGRLREIAEAHRKGEVEAGDALARTLDDPADRVAAEWIALRASGRSLGFRRIVAFMERAPDLPMQEWLQRRAEDALMIERPRPEVVLAFFEGRGPLGPNGRAALAAAKLQTGARAEAEALALAAYRDRALTRDVAEVVEKTFPELITPHEKALRAHRLILTGRRDEGLRLARALGPDHEKLALAVGYAAGSGRTLGAIEAVPPALRAHPSFVKAAAQVRRRRGDDKVAVAVMLGAPKAAADVADAEEWWIERRMLARRLLDAGDAAAAYRIAAEPVGLSPARRAEAEFHAGWIALRFLGFEQTAALHFRASAEAAPTPQAKSRAHYWLGRAIEAGALGEASEGYPTAAGWPTTYYGQLAAERIGRTGLELAETSSDVAEQATFAVTLTGQVIDRLLAAGLPEFAAPLAIDHARRATAEEIDALAQRFVARNDAATVLAIGRTGAQRGLPVDHHAFPIFGVPAFQPLPGSAETAMVYAIARQESAFRADAVSHANARGLMQMLPSTAASTARRFQVAFDAGRLISDPAFNARLGAAHLGELLEETRGSLIMTFAAYNAGGHRVRDWVRAYGDPRSPDVDPVDWVERIPFSETRNYVQRVMENLIVYRARLSGGRTALSISRDLASGGR